MPAITVGFNPGNQTPNFSSDHSTALCSLYLIKICVKHHHVTFHMTLHTAVAHCQSGSLPTNPEKAKQLVLELEINLVHAAHTEKGEVLVTSKGPDDNFSERREK